MIRREKDRPLLGLNTFAIAARSKEYIEFSSAEDLHDLFHGQEEAPGNWYLLGGGSNILFTGDYPGTLLHPVSRGIRVTREDEQYVVVRADAGVTWDGLVAFCVDRGWGGLENLSFIPGTVGASPVQNIGAYGVEAKDAAERVQVYLPHTDETRWLTASECRFGYRDSVFKRELKGKAIVTAVEYRLNRRPVLKLDYGDIRGEMGAGTAPSIAEVRNAVIRIRRRKLPDPAVTGNAGSFFKNPVVPPEKAEALRRAWPGLPVYPAPGGTKVSAAWLIDKAGWKGHRTSTVGVHDRQALVLVNLGGCTGKEVLDLAGAIRADVKEKFGVEIEMEVNVL